MGKLGRTETLPGEEMYNLKHGRGWVNNQRRPLRASHGSAQPKAQRVHGVSCRNLIKKNGPIYGISRNPKYFLKILKHKKRSGGLTLSDSRSCCKTGTRCGPVVNTNVQMDGRDLRAQKSRLVDLE